jgi:repressor of nif and glnA expression
LLPLVCDNIFTKLHIDNNITVLYIESSATDCRKDIDMNVAGTPEIERKTLSILKILSSSRKPVGASIIAQHLKDLGVELSDRAVRYHLRIMDVRGLTELVGNRDGRRITAKGVAEIKKGLVKEKVGLAITRIELLAFHTDFDYQTRQGSVPVNISIFPRTVFKKALLAMEPAFNAGLCVSSLVAVAGSRQLLTDLIIPEDKIGLVTVCSAVINGVLLKAGIPMDSRFSGILQIVDHKPVRFTELIHYNGCSLDPSEIFMKARMATVTAAFSSGNGEILANFREIPAVCLPVAERVLAGLKAAGIEGVMIKGKPSEPVCEVPVELNRIGLVLIGGLNPVVAAQEAGLEVENYSMSSMVDSQELMPFSELLNQIDTKLHENK